MTARSLSQNRGWAATTALVPATALLASCFALSIPAQQAQAATPTAGSYEIQYKTHEPKGSYCGSTTLRSYYKVKVISYSGGKVKLRFSYGNCYMADEFSSNVATGKVKGSKTTVSFRYGGLGGRTGRATATVAFHRGYINVNIKSSKTPDWAHYDIGTDKTVKIKKGTHSKYID